MRTLFQVITLDSWATMIARPVWKVYPGLALCFIGFIFLTTFGLINVLVGVIVENTLAAATQNSGLQDQRSWQRLRRDLMLLRDVFEEADTDASGGLEIDEFEEVMQRPDVRRALRCMGVPIDEPRAMHQLLAEEAHCDKSLPVDVFVRGALRLREAPTTLDLRQMIVQVKGTHQRVIALEKAIGSLEDRVERNDASILSELAQLRRRHCAQWLMARSTPSLHDVADILGATRAELEQAQQLQDAVARSPPASGLRAVSELPAPLLVAQRR